jgi:hypothetical protein
MEESFEANTLDRQSEAANAENILDVIADRIGFTRHPDEIAASIKSTQSIDANEATPD